MPAVNGKHAPRPAPPRRQYSFTDFQVHNPTVPPPGNHLDAEISRLFKALVDIISWVSVSLNSDGSLRVPPDPPPVGPPRPPKAGAYSIAGADPNALAEDWAEVSFEWAEHMPDTIPPNILATMGITGDHWSSRWWAHQALVNAQTPVSLGVNTIAPVTGATVVLADFRPVFVNNPAVLAALTVMLPPFPGLTRYVEISFLNPVTALTIQDSAGAAVTTAPTSAYGPGSALEFRYSDIGWVYWK